jgi:hypothetical protein
MDAYRSHPDGTVARNVPGPSLFGNLRFEFGQALKVPPQYQGSQFTWGSGSSGGQALALAVLANCLGEDHCLAEGLPTMAAALHDRFATDVVAHCDPAEPLNLQWDQVLRWLDQHLNGGKPGALIRLCEGVDRFEGVISQALGRGPYDERRRYVDPDLWSRWNLSDFLHTAIAKRTFPLENLPRVMGSLMDVKFKLYCLFEVDLPTYAIAIEHYGLNETDTAATPHGLAIRLSSEATMIVKVRSIWESVMNAVFAAEGLKRPPNIKAVDPNGFSFGSKSRAFFKYVAARPQWSGLAGFRPLVESLEDDRTPEVHLLSQLRGDFVEGEYRPLRRILDPLNSMLFYVWDHLSAVVFFDVGPTYDVAAGTGVHIDLTRTSV